jgi:hypothetical protein
MFAENVLTVDHSGYKLSVRRDPTLKEEQLSLAVWKEKWGLQNLGRF